MRIVTSRDENVNNDGHLWIGVGAGALREQALDANIIGTGRKTCFVKFKKRKLVLGSFSRPVIVLEDRKPYEAGILPPQSAPTLAAAGVGTVTGAVIGACSFRHRINGKIIHESDLGPFSPAVSLTDNAGRDWSGIPTIAQRRVTHVVGYYSFEGDEMREAWERPIGTLTVSETVGALARGDVAPDFHELLVPPWTGFGENWHARAWYAGLDGTHPYRAWYSEPNKPETIEGHIDTLGYEAITGIVAQDDILVLMCRRLKYQVRGYTQSDFKIDRLPGFGCVSHHSIAKDYAGRVWWAAEEGIVANDEYQSADVRTYWRKDIEQSPEAFEASWAIHDRKFSVYKLCTPRRERAGTAADPKSFYYVQSYFPDVAPATTFDIRAREDTAASYDEDGRVITASCDGIVRRENVESNGDDDGDAYQKRFVLRTGHINMGRPGGDEKEGKRLVRLWVFVRSELTGWTLYAIGGEEDSWLRLSNDIPIDPNQVVIDNTRHFWRAVIAASAQAGYTPPNVGLDNWFFTNEPKTVHHFQPERVSGRGFVIQIDATAPKSLRYTGFGGLWEKGEGATRGAVLEQSV